VITVHGGAAFMNDSTLMTIYSNVSVWTRGSGTYEYQQDLGSWEATPSGSWISYLALDSVVLTLKLNPSTRPNRWDGGRPTVEIAAVRLCPRRAARPPVPSPLRSSPSARYCARCGGICGARPFRRQCTMCRWTHLSLSPVQLQKQEKPAMAGTGRAGSYLSGPKT
jgi:hypothetical protein